MRFHEAVTVLRRASGTDAAGLPSGDYATVATIRGRVIEMRQGEGQTFGEIPLRQAVIMLPRDADVRATDRLTVRGTTWRLMDTPFMQGNARGHHLEARIETVGERP